MKELTAAAEQMGGWGGGQTSRKLFTFLMETKDY